MTIFLAQPMNAEQQQQLLLNVAQLVNRQGQPRDNDRDCGAKVEPLKTVEPEEWSKFRRNVEGYLVAKNTWTAAQKKRHLRSLLQDDAGLIVSGVQFAYDDDNVTFDTVLTRVEQKFLAGRGTSSAHNDFISASQRAAETLHSWHGRLLDINTRAYPDLNNRETNETLMNQWIIGLRDEQLRSSVVAWQHANYGDLLINACRADAILTSVRRARGGASLNSLSQPISDSTATISSLSDQKCHLCDQPGHFLRDCRLMTKAMQIARSRGRGRGSPRRGRGGYQPRNRGGTMRGNGSYRGFGNSRGNSSSSRGRRSDSNGLNALLEDPQCILDASYHEEEPPNDAEDISGNE